MRCVEQLPLCERTVSQIRKQGGEALAIQTDLTDERQVEQLIVDTVTRYGRVDILVNNAGIGGGDAWLTQAPRPSIR